MDLHQIKVISNTTASVLYNECNGNLHVFNILPFPVYVGVMLFRTEDSRFDEVGSQ